MDHSRARYMLVQHRNYKVLSVHDVQQLLNQAAHSSAHNISIPPVPAKPRSNPKSLHFKRRVPSSVTPPPDRNPKLPKINLSRVKQSDAKKQKNFCNLTSLRQLSEQKPKFKRKISKLYKVYDPNSESIITQISSTEDPYQQISNDKKIDSPGLPSYQISARTSDPYQQQIPRIKRNNLTVGRVMKPERLFKPASVQRSISVQTSVEKLLMRQAMPELEEIKSELEQRQFPETEHHSINHDSETVQVKNNSELQDTLHFEAVQVQVQEIKDSAATQKARPTAAGNYGFNEVLIQAKQRPEKQFKSRNTLEPRKYSFDSDLTTGVQQIELNLNQQQATIQEGEPKYSEIEEYSCQFEQEFVTFKFLKDKKSYDECYMLEDIFQVNMVDEMCSIGLFKTFSQKPELKKKKTIQDKSQTAHLAQLILDQFKRVIQERRLQFIYLDHTEMGGQFLFVKKNPSMITQRSNHDDMYYKIPLRQISISKVTQQEFMSKRFKLIHSPSEAKLRRKRFDQLKEDPFEDMCMLFRPRTKEDDEEDLRGFVRLLKRDLALRLEVKRLAIRQCAKLSKTEFIRIAVPDNTKLDETGVYRNEEPITEINPQDIREIGMLNTRFMYEHLLREAPDLEPQKVAELYLHSNKISTLDAIVRKGKWIIPFRKIADDLRYDIRKALKAHQHAELGSSPRSLCRTTTMSSDISLRPILNVAIEVHRVQEEESAEFRGSLRLDFEYQAMLNINEQIWPVFVYKTAQLSTHKLIQPKVINSILEKYESSHSGTNDTFLNSFYGSEQSSSSDEDVKPQYSVEIRAPSKPLVTQGEVLKSYHYFFHQQSYEKSVTEYPGVPPQLEDSLPLNRVINIKKAPLIL